MVEPFETGEMDGFSWGDAALLGIYDEKYMSFFLGLIMFRLNDWKWLMMVRAIVGDTCLAHLDEKVG